MAVTDPDDAIREVIGRLHGVVPRPGYYVAQCPAHEDKQPSLSIGRGTDQPVVLRCHAGCTTEDIVAAIGMRLSDIMTPREDRPDDGEWTPYGPAIAKYQYVDEDGVLLFEVMRTADKNFPVRIPDRASKSGYRWRIGDTRRVIYRMPTLRPAIDRGKFIYIVEGEKDVHAIEARGEVATCNPGGAGKWRDEYSEVLRDALVIIIADADKPGREHAHKVAASLKGIAQTVEIREAADGKDVSDHLASGRTLADLVVTAAAADEAPAELALDLLTFVSQPDPEVRWTIPHLLERGDRLIWTGYEGLGKTTVTRQIGVCAAAGIQPFNPAKHYEPQRVLFIDCENKVTRSRRLFRNLVGVTQGRYRKIQPGMFRIVHRPDGINLLKAEEAAFVIERVTAYRPDLLIIGPLYKLHDVDANEERAAGAIIRALEVATMVCGSALIVEAHSPHGVPRQLRPRGSSIFMAWPDYGFGMAPGIDKDPSRVKVDPWRGSRDEDHAWPTELVRGSRSELSWTVPMSTPSSLRHGGMRWNDDDGTDD